MQDSRGPLVRAERPERDDEVADRVGHVRDRSALTGHRSESARLQLTRRDPERRSPDPPSVVAHVVAAAERLGERLGHRIARELPIAGECHERTPELRALLAPHAFDRFPGFRAHGRILHHTRTGTGERGTV